MKNQFLLVLFCVALFSGCKENEGEIIPVVEQDLKWENSYTEVLNGSSSIKINLMLTNTGTFYYIISEKGIEKVESSFIRTESREKTNTDIISSGIVEISDSQVGDTLEILVPGLTPQKEYHTYTLSETSKVGEESEILPAIVKPFTNLLSARQKENSFESSTMKKNMNYLSYSLEDYYLNPTEKFPLLIFLHGMGEYAAEGEFNLYRNTTLPQLIQKGNDYPFIVISPQLTTGSWSPEFVDEMIDHIVANYRVDESRIYMTGISLGGIGTWNYVVKYPERLAAVVPISGSGNVSQACNMSQVPVWAFHNSSDGLVHSAGSVNMIEALNNCNPECKKPPLLTLYPDSGHNAWVRTYNGTAGHDIFNWLLENHL